MNKNHLILFFTFFFLLPTNSAYANIAWFNPFPFLVGTFSFIVQKPINILRNFKSPFSFKRPEDISKVDTSKELSFENQQENDSDESDTITVHNKIIRLPTLGERTPKGILDWISDKLGMNNKRLASERVDAYIQEMNRHDAKTKGKIKRKETQCDADLQKKFENSTEHTDTLNKKLDFLEKLLKQYSEEADAEQIQNFGEANRNCLDTTKQFQLKICDDILPSFKHEFLQEMDKHHNDLYDHVKQTTAISTSRSNIYKKQKTLINDRNNISLFIESNHDNTNEETFDNTGLLVGLQVALHPAYLQIKN